MIANLRKFLKLLSTIAKSMLAGPMTVPLSLETMMLRFQRLVALGVCFGLSNVAEAQSLQEQLVAEGAIALAKAARTEGDPQRGAILFHQPYFACAKCHAVGQSATTVQSLGPDLTKLGKEVSAEHIVESVLEPSKVIRKGFEPITVQTVGGKSIVGVLIEDAADKLVLRETSEGKLITLKKAEIDEQVIGKTSIMPPGQANQLASRQQFLDLAKYLIEIADGGSKRAQELQPSASLLVMQIPEYEKQVDHAAMIAEFDRPDVAGKAFKRGEAIYTRLCINCHGTKEQPGSLPTSLKFAEGKFKNGSDPLRMYQTLTHGFGLMAPQTWMVPQQKYDVIHYVRETYLKPYNVSQYSRVDDRYLAELPKGNTRGPAPSNIDAWSAMNYGPFLIATYEAKEPKFVAEFIDDEGKKSELVKPNFAYKGIAVRLDSGPGGVSRGNHWSVFEHDTLRMSAAWSATPREGEPNFINWQGINFDGRHGAHPQLAGAVQIANPSGPGWANPETGRFDEVRVIGRDGRRYGPLPRSWGKYRGLYQYGEQVVMSYSVGETNVLEMPGVAAEKTSPIFKRTFQVGPRPRAMTMLVASPPTADSRVETIGIDAGNNKAQGSVAMLVSPPSSHEAGIAFDGRTSLNVAKAEDFDLTSQNYSIVARIRTKRGGSLFCQTKSGDAWVPDGKALFVRGGKLCFDIGWVGAVTSKTNVADGKWHHVAMTWTQKTGRVRLFVDGKIDGEGTLKPQGMAVGQVVRVGFAAPNFPEPQSYFDGEMSELRFYQRDVSTELPAASEKKLGEQSLVAYWRFEKADGNKTVGDKTDGDVVADATGRGHVARRSHAGEQSGPSTIAAGLTPQIAGAEWLRETNGALLLRLPAGDESLRFTLSTRTLSQKIVEADALVSLTESPAVDLAALTHGGPRRWPEVLTSSVVLGADNGPFAVDVLNPPVNNPWLCQMRLTGFDFYPEGNRAAVCSWDGDVWMVSFDEPPADSGSVSEKATRLLKWQRIASGLFQPLGLKIVNGQIHVTCRDQLVILRDFNGDGETDFYECLNSDHQVTEHFHEFAMGLQVDAAGNFYYAKSARHALSAVVPHHGTLLRVSPDGAKTDIIANGFRAANGVCLNPDGSFVVTDQEGHWNPKNRINWVVPAKPGEKPRFYGNMFGYHDVTDSSDAVMEPPLCWITNAFDRSPAELLWVTSDRWGPLKGSLLNLSYGYGKVFVVPFEEVDGVKQGGLFELPLPTFPTGTMRGRFHPTDGQLYLCGMFAWAGNAIQPGGFYRVRATGRPMHVPVGLHATKRGMSMTFTSPLDREAVTQVANYAVKTWSLKRTANYGSQHHDERSLDITKVNLSEDGKTVSLEIPKIEPTWCMEIKFTLKSASGEAIQGTFNNTVHRLGLP